MEALHSFDRNDDRHQAARQIDHLLSGDSVPKVLIVDDDAHLLESYELALRSTGYFHLTCTADSSSVMNLLEDRPIDLVVLDLMMPEPSGETLLKMLHEQHPQLPAIVMTGVDHVETAVRCMQLGAAGYLVKPVSRTMLVSSIQDTIDTVAAKAKSKSARLDISIASTGADFEPPEGHVISSVPGHESTVLLADLSNSTKLFDFMNPEDVYGLISTIKLSAVKIIQSLGGVVNQFVGDEVVGLFGPSDQWSSSSVGAVAAALEVHSVVREILPERWRSLRQQLNMHSGVSTGQLIIQPGNRLSGLYDISGHALHIASKLRDIARPDQILVDHVTAENIGSTFRTYTLKEIKVPGVEPGNWPREILTDW